MLKNKEEVEVNSIMSFCEEILRYLEDGLKEDHETNQYYVRIKSFFRGYAVLD